MKTRRLQNLCCATQSTLFYICLSEADLKRLGVWQDRLSPRGMSPSVWCRAWLHRACRTDPRSAEAVSDHLDLRFLDTVALIRSMDASQVQDTLHLWLQSPNASALPALLWSLCTDARDCVHQAGIRLGQEAMALASRSFVAGSFEPESSPMRGRSN